MFRHGTSIVAGVVNLDRPFHIYHTQCLPLFTTQWTKLKRSSRGLSATAEAAATADAADLRSQTPYRTNSSYSTVILNG